MGLFEVLEELAVGIDHQHIAFVPEHVCIRIDASIEGVEFRVLIEGIRINACRSRITFTT